MRERRKRSLEFSLCILFKDKIFYSHTNDGSLCSRKQTKQTQVGGRLLGPEKKKHRLPVYRALKTGRRILRSESTDNCIASRSSRN